MLNDMYFNYKMTLSINTHPTYLILQTQSLEPETELITHFLTSLGNHTRAASVFGSKSSGLSIWAATIFIISTASLRHANFCFHTAKEVRSFCGLDPVRATSVGHRIAVGIASLVTGPLSCSAAIWATTVCTCSTISFDFATASVVAPFVVGSECGGDTVRATAVCGRGTGWRKGFGTGTAEIIGTGGSSASVLTTAIEGGGTAGHDHIAVSRLTRLSGAIDFLRLVLFALRMHLDAHRGPGWTSLVVGAGGGRLAIGTAAVAVPVTAIDAVGASLAIVALGGRLTVRATSVLCVLQRQHNHGRQAAVTEVMFSVSSSSNSCLQSQEKGQNLSFISCLLQLLCGIHFLTSLNLQKMLLHFTPTWNRFI